MKKLLVIAVMAAKSVFALEVGDFAPCVVLEDIQTNGKSINQCIRTPNQKGQAVILDFSLPECEDCAKNLPLLSQLAGDVHAVATTRVVMVSRDKAKIQNFMNLNKSSIQFPVSLDLKLQAMRTYGVDAGPTIFVLDSKNIILFKHVGILTDDAIAKIKALVDTLE